MFPENCTKRSGTELEEAVPGVTELAYNTVILKPKDEVTFKKLNDTLSEFLKEREPKYKWWVYVPEHTKYDLAEGHNLEYYVMCEKPDKTFQSFYFKIVAETYE